MLGNADKSVGVFLIERRRLVREITANTINEAEGVWVAASSGGEDVGAALMKSAPDVILAGYYPGMDAVFQAIAEYRKSRKCAAVILTDQSEWRAAAEVVGHDACFVSKQTGIAGLLDVIRRVTSGIPAETLGWRRDQAVREAPRLSPRELEILKRAACGQSNREIAEEVHSSLKTVDTHMHNILDKLNLQSRTQAVLYAVQNKMLSLEELTTRQAE
ncbi:MAG TPA: response regulator transcription factor [Armatimonadota bacterium]